MKTVFGCGVLAVVLGCTHPAQDRMRPTADSTAGIPPAPPKDAAAAPAAWKENMAMIGAVILDMTMIDSVRYSLTLELRTVLPSGNMETMAESGQTVVVSPDYALGPDGSISLDVDRNRRLFRFRERKPGEGMVGRITLHPDGTWGLFDTELH
jgi:hypothetical protein